MAEEFIVIEADGGSRGNPGIAGYGALLRDSRGSIVNEEAGYIGLATNNVAEYRGLIGGLSMAKAVGGLKRLKIQMDSKLVIEQMSGRWKIKHEAMKLLAAQAQELLDEFEEAGVRVEYQWMPRAGNKEADRLSNVGMDAGEAGHAAGWKVQSRKVSDYKAINDAGDRQESGVFPTASLAYLDIGVPDFSRTCSELDWLLSKCGFRLEEKISAGAAWRGAGGVRFRIRDGGGSGGRARNPKAPWLIGINVPPGVVQGMVAQLPAHGWVPITRQHTLFGRADVLIAEHRSGGRVELIPMPPMP